MRCLIKIFMTGFLFFTTGFAWAEEDLLDILLENKTITREQYEVLKKDRGPGNSQNLGKGLGFKSPKGDFSYKIGGRLMLDAVFYDKDSRPLGSGTELRRGRIFIAGKMYDDWRFKGNYDFSGNSVSVKDAWIGYAGLESFFIQIGHFKEPFSLEEQTSSKYITFMERALPNVFAPGRNIGIGFMTHGDNWTLSAGAFGEGAGDQRTDDEGYGVSGRVTFAPLHQKDRALHFGFGTAFRVPDVAGGNVSFSERPESHVTSVKLVDTGIIEKALSYDTVGFETALVWGSFSIQGEYMVSHVNREGAVPNLDFNGLYAYFSWFLTGESRVYSAVNGKFGRVKPLSNAGADGIGAWEFGIRYSKLDLNSGVVSGGEEENVTFGLNWYVNPRLRFMANYIFVETDANAGHEDPKVFQMRAQVDF